MKETSMTAKISMFSRYYHSQNNGTKIYDDSLAGKLLSEEEKQSIISSMTAGISFFNPQFKGTEAEALRWIVDNQLSPSTLGRAVFCEQHLYDAVQSGVTQYLILAAGYDTFAYRQPEWAHLLEIFELDLPEITADKQERLYKAGISTPSNVQNITADLNDCEWVNELVNHRRFDRSKMSFGSLLGISYYLPKAGFENTIKALADIFPSGSGILFDYPDENSYTNKAGERAQRQQMLAGGAGETMKASYSQNEILELLFRYAFAVEEDLPPEQITERYFIDYNRANPDYAMSAFDNVNYCFARKK